ncbi:hypothetical protein F4677DRAFT_444766 [Hypoxylon crocopeplum]|nr:hypothetical protein F4677DRAFT_444766 [Hypoxylon crocopeplum]
MRPPRGNPIGNALQDPALDGLGFLARRQTTGVDLGIVAPPAHGGGFGVLPSVRFCAETSGSPNATLPVPTTETVPASWRGKLICLSVITVDYVMSAASAARPEDVVVIGYVDAGFLYREMGLLRANL